VNAAAVFKHLPSSELYIFKSCLSVLCNLFKLPPLLDGYKLLKICPTPNAISLPRSVNNPPHFSINVAFNNTLLPFSSLMTLLGLI